LVYIPAFEINNFQYGNEAPQNTPNSFRKWHKDPKKLHKMTGIPLATVYRTIAKIKSGEDLQRKSGSGAKRKIVSNDLRRVSQLAHHHPKFSSAKIGELAAKRGNPLVHPNTILNTLKRSGYL
jgi:transposase